MGGGVQKNSHRPGILKKVKMRQEGEKEHEKLERRSDSRNLATSNEEFFLASLARENIFLASLVREKTFLASLVREKTFLAGQGREETV